MRVILWLIRYCYALLQILVSDTKETRYGYVSTPVAPPPPSARGLWRVAYVYVYVYVYDGGYIVIVCLGLARWRWEVGRLVLL